ncbi:MAG TPA: hypothetical protein PK828_06915 [Limnochordia bacterium]|nr:hypothetical protein [Limnochordia bacterium]
MKDAKAAKAAKAGNKGNKAAYRLQAAQKAGLKRLVYALTALLLLVLAAIVWVYFGLDEPATTGTDSQTESRRLYIGDMITLEITAQSLTEAEIREHFSDFEIVDLQWDRGRFLVTLRTFEPGEYSVLIGSKEVLIQVGSTLEDIDRDDVFEGSRDVIAPPALIPWRLVFYAAAGIFVLSGGVLLVKALIRRREKKLSPYQLFCKKAGALALDSASYFVDLTLLFKRYLEGLYQFRIIGKTSTEIMDELQKLPALAGLLPEIDTWLTECDRFKFSGVTLSRDEKAAHYRKLVSIAERINQLHQQLEGQQLQKLTSQKEGAV